MSDLKIWHNPRCSKSRQTLALLEERGLEPQIIDYREIPPSEAELQGLLKILNCKAIDIMRSNDALFGELGLAKSDSNAVLIAAMIQNPMLIERPIVFANGKAAIGRPPEAVLEIL